MSRRLKLIVSYDGARFGGWQSQAHRNTIQDHIERAFQRVSGERVRVHGAGRTDAGVHALAQCAHVDAPAKNLSAERWMRALNALLPPTIRVLRCRYVPKHFHARQCAKAKLYRYRIWSAPVLPPLEYGRAWHITAPLDFELLRFASKHFAGTYNFAGFAANRGGSSNQADSPRGRMTNGTVRTIYDVRVRRHGPCLTIEFDGNGFLYKMVRLMVGAVVQCALGKESVEEIRRCLASGRIGRAHFAAPAAGLFLVRVRY
jgi:tRNA pseudouridine38-40 synthase